MIPGQQFDHNLNKIPLEIKSEIPKGTTDKYVWIYGFIGREIHQDENKQVDSFSMAIDMRNYGPWLGFCTKNSEEVSLNPIPTGPEVTWTVFKTNTELIMECNGYFCFRYKYTSSTLQDNRCSSFEFPSLQLVFNDSMQAAAQYRLSGRFDLTIV